VGGTDRRLRNAEIAELQSRLVDFDYMIKDFYRLRELDELGFASRKRLEGLGLSDVADRLESAAS
jgi:aldehyde:ferredoxin oxidoreductase